MALFPTESRDVKGLRGDEYEKFKVGPTCSKPGCTRLTDHSHHLFSRGKMGGAFDWVRLPDGTETGNLVPLCWRDHESVTNNQVHITYENGKFLWEGEPLTWQPPKKGQVANTPVLESPVPESAAVKRPKNDVCHECGRALPRPKIETPLEDKKTRKTWAVAVPWTVEENGADTLDALLQAAREEMDGFGLDWGEGHKVKFFVLSTALALFVQHAQAILNDGQQAPEEPL